jgi:TPR repeat protein
MTSKFEIALKAYEAGEYSRAFSAFVEAAKNGDADAMSQIALMYTHGEGVRQNFDSALEWELKSWEGGNKDTAINIAITYRLKVDLVK